MLKIAAAVTIIAVLQIIFRKLRKGAVEEANYALAGFPKTEVQGRSLDDGAREAQIRRDRDTYILAFWLSQIVITLVAVIAAISYTPNENRPLMSMIIMCASGYVAHLLAALYRARRRQHTRWLLDTFEGPDGHFPGDGKIKQGIIDEEGMYIGLSWMAQLVAPLFITILVNIFT